MTATKASASAITGKAAGATKLIGIDLGTTNTVAAIAGAALSLTGSSKGDGAFVLPSVVAYPPTGAVVVGHDALRRKAIDPKNTIYSAKRIIGRDWNDRVVKQFGERYPFVLEPKGGMAAFRTRSGLYSAVDIATEILTAIRMRGRVDFGQTAAVIAVPSLFGVAEREATIEAGRRAGLRQVTVIDEPVATARAYLTTLGAKPRYAAVYDLGGGTFDLAVVDCTEQPFEVLAHGGDLYLGGDDVDRLLADWVTARVLSEHHWDLASDPAVSARLVLECERAKCLLSEATSGKVKVDLTRVDPGAPVAAAELWLEERVASSLCADLVRRTFLLCDEVLRKAGLRASAIDAVFVAGGATLLPPVRAGVAAYFGRDVDYLIHPMLSVAIGASQAADLLVG
jgi:molecular chaperone DnaK